MMKQKLDIKNLLTQPVPWLAHNVSNAGILISSRIRLARNISGFLFPLRAKATERQTIFDQIQSTLGSIPELNKSSMIDLKSLPEIEKQILFERHLISHEQINSRIGSGLVVGERESFSIMVNEEDHLRIQILSPGLELNRNWSKINRLDDLISSTLNYAYDNTIGFLTSCPTNIGTGLRASVMLHLPGLVLTEQIKPVTRGLNKMGLAVRGLFGEGSEAFGDLFQISNQSTLGESEKQIIARISRVVDRLLEHEKNARYILLETKPDYLFDYVSRAYGVLSHARLLSSEEAMKKLSALRVGIDLKMFTSLTLETLNRLMVDIQPGHLQKLYVKKMNPERRDSYRATLVKEYLC